MSPGVNRVFACGFCTYGFRILLAVPDIMNTTTLNVIHLFIFFLGLQFISLNIEYSHSSHVFNHKQYLTQNLIGI
jgi:hypothetical protein